MINIKYFVQAYLNKNLGDDLFIKLLSERYTQKFYSISNLKYESFENFKIYSGKKVKILSRLYKLFSFKKDNLYNLLAKHSKINIIIGGSIFMESNYKSRKELLKSMKKKMKIKNTYILGSNFGPYDTEEFLNLHKEYFKNIKDICFRDKYSYNLFKEFNNVRYAPDIIFSLDKDRYNNREDNTVVFSVIDLKKRKNINKYIDSYENKIIEFIKYFHKNHMKIILMSFCKAEGDEQAIERITNKLNIDVEKYYYEGNIDEAIEIISTAKIIVGTRFHANILGMCFNKTVIPIAYSNKTLNVLKDMDFKGKILDIRKIGNFNIDKYNINELIYVKDIALEKEKALEQFNELDKVLEKRKC